MKMSFTSFYNLWKKYSSLVWTGLFLNTPIIATFTLHHLLLILVLFIFFLIYYLTIFSCPCVALCFNGLLCLISNVVPVVNINELTLTLRKQQLVYLYMLSTRFTSKGHIWPQMRPLDVTSQTLFEFDWLRLFEFDWFASAYFLSKNRRPC